MWIVVGLGNPGMAYSRTRHNVGFIFIKRVAKEWGAKFKKKRPSAKTTGVKRKKELVLLALPQTYMNRSGLAVNELIIQNRAEIENVIIVFDDFDIPLGSIKIRKTGGAGTHKGMSSVIAELNTSQISRIRIGIGPAPEEMDAVDYVLSRFTKDESVKLEDGLKKAREALSLILDGEIEKAMNEFN